MTIFKQLISWLDGKIWGTDPGSLPVWNAWLVRWARLFYLVGRDLLTGQLTLRAMSLVYTTLLSLVPLLAVSFSVLKAFDVHNQIEPTLLNFLEPLGEKGVEITSNVIGFVDKMKVGVLGAVGLGLLFYVVVSLIQKIERSFNYTWHVTRLRPFAQRFSDYLSVILIGPVLVFSALGATASLMSHDLVQTLLTVPGLSWVVATVGKLVPYILIFTAFTFIYMFVPNTRVRLRSALVGAIVAGFLWQTVGWGFASFVVTSTKYAAVYSGFAIVVLFMIWVYLGWLILLVGASIAFYHQHPEQLVVKKRDFRLSNRLKERLALLSMYLITKTHYQGGNPWTARGLSRYLGIPTDSVENVLDSLVAKGLLIKAGEEPPVYVPDRAPETVLVKTLLESIRSSEEANYSSLSHLPREEKVESVIQTIEDAFDKALDGMSLRSLVMEERTVETKPEEQSETAG